MRAAPLLASASPALADFWYQVSPYDGSVIWADDDTLEWEFDSAVPAGVDIRVGFTLITLNRGGSMPQAKNLLLRLVVTKAGSPPSTPPLVVVDEFTCREYWGAPYDYNAWMTGHPDYVIPHFNPKIGAVVTGRDWLVPLPALTPGTTRSSSATSSPRSGWIRCTCRRGRLRSRRPGTGRTSAPRSW